MSAQPDRGPQQAALLAPGPDSTDADLARWRDAVSSGQLPEPTKARWQVLRAGVVNLWEFDTAEYWFADGRAQFIGQNQSGKSTLMALTTLIMLAGDLDRQYVDTFGEQHKSFRYYIEPTEEANDRRDTDTSLSRGWAWVEYGRHNGTDTEFFTTLLYAQARRGAKDYVKQWITCNGTARVGRELLLTTGALTKQPAELSGVPGFKVAISGQDYKNRLATGLFGFEDTGRLDAVVKMLKVLRTPHLGRKLDPVFFTLQMREALPSIAKSEIDELAEGWDQLDKLANDRDSAESACQAVTAFLRKAWNPWADSVVRRHADELASTITRFDDVTKSIRRAEESQSKAEERKASLDEQVERATDALERDDANFEALRDSQDYKDAQQATARVEALRSAATSSRAAAGVASSRATTAQNRAAQSRTALERTEGKLAHAQQAQQDAVASAGDHTRTAGLPSESAQWLAAGDIARLDLSVTERREHVKTGRRLLSALATATGQQNTAERRNDDAQADLKLRQGNADTADTRLDGALQELSDSVETWAATLQDAPDIAVRSSWLESVLEQTDAPAGRAVLHARLIADWLTPRTTSLREQILTKDRNAADLTGNADQFDRDIVTLLSETDPQPAGPLRWSRRARPDSGPDGAPLWLLLDPADDVDPAALGCLEAALDATGLLDAWISPDGVYLPERDGHDLAVDLRQHPQDAPTAATLSTALVPAQSAGPLSPTLQALLATVEYVPAGQPLPASGVAVSSDGRWRTAVTSGTAGAAEHGAELLGTAARTVARDRRVSALQAEVRALREQAATLRTSAEQDRAAVKTLETQAAAAPHDDVVVAAAHARRHARNELTKARTLCAQRAQQLQEARTQTATASTNLHDHTGRHTLPVTENGLAETAAALDRASRAISELRLALANVSSALQLAARDREALAADDRDAATLTEQSDLARREADAAQDAADNAEEALGQSEKDVLAALEQLRERRTKGKELLKQLNVQCLQQASEVAKATEKLERAESDREDAEQQRSAALTAWWRPVDAGLAALRGLPAAPSVQDRRLTHAVTQSRAARDLLTPANWPSDSADSALAVKDQLVNKAYAKLAGPALIELRTVLESSGGRSATVLDPEETGGLPAVVVLVDSSGAQVDPVDAVARLTEQADNLAQLHDQKMQSVLVELLSSTFVEHLRERLSSVISLVDSVNKVLGQHPTGANRTKLRLRRVPADGQKDGFAVLDALEKRFIGDADVQDQVRSFLEKQIREAQDLGRAGDLEWKDHLASLLDYRKWFDVVTEFQVMDNPKWTALTAEVHAKDSGGGKVVTLLQPLLATLVALYDECEHAPRPLWLDEAFSGVDDSNISTMLDLLVEFDLDFLLAGPGALVASAEVPSAAAWFITRAPAPDAGVDLSLMLWAGRTMSLVPLPRHGIGSAAGARPAPPVDEDRPSLFDEDPA